MPTVWTSGHSGVISDCTPEDLSQRGGEHERWALVAAASRAAGYGLYLGSGARGPVFAPPEHGALVLGPPRSGKTTGIMIPNVLAASGSVVAASTKPDVMSSTAAIRRSTGRCTLLDPSGATRSPFGVDVVGWSPLTSAHNWDAAVLTAESMVGAARPGTERGDASHWTERAAALLACVLHAAALDDARVEDVVSAVNRHDADRSTTVLTRNGADLALDLLTGIRATDGREQSGIWSTLSGVLAAYRTEAALACARAEPLDPAQLLEPGSTLYIVATSEHQRHAAPVIAGALRDVRSAAYTKAAAHPPATGQSGTPRSAADGSAADPPLVLVLDELAGIAPLHDLPTLVAEGASQGVLTLASLQDLSQARARWGAAAEGFLTLFGAKIVLRGVGDTRTLDALSLLAGEHEELRSTTTRPSGLRGRWSATRSVTTDWRRRLPADAIANVPAGTAVVYLGTQPGRVTVPAVHAPGRGPWRSEVARATRRTREIARPRGS
ncbi:MAG TPA: TraM recognition domain-containing protein [Acidimicrobiales bacterium]|nr:TraM recognition domain-containing protein [Acidimicrobiales bacterium]